MTEESKPKKKLPQARLRVPKDLNVAYANLVRIAHTPSELMFDFGRYLPGDPGAGGVSRVLMSPLGAKLLLQALTENIAKYETAFGEIPVPKKHTLADSLFRPPPINPEETPEGDKK